MNIAFITQSIKYHLIRNPDHMYPTDSERSVPFNIHGFFKSINYSIILFYSKSSCETKKHNDTYFS